MIDELIKAAEKYRAAKQALNSHPPGPSPKTQHFEYLVWREELADLELQVSYTAKVVAEICLALKDANLAELEKDGKRVKYRKPGNRTFTDGVKND